MVFLSLHRTRGRCEPVFRVLQDPADNAAVVVHVTYDVVQRREAVQLAFFFHLRELMPVELRFADNAPVMRGGIHRETRS